MFVDYLRSEDPAYIQWIHTLPGVRVCQFKLKQVSEKSMVTFQEHQSSDTFEVFFCLDGQITAVLPGAELHKIEKYNIFVLSNISNLLSLKIGENVHGVLVVVDLQLLQERTPSMYPALNLNIDRCCLKSNLAVQHGSASLCNSCWSQSVFELQAYLPDKIFSKYCAFKALELLYILSVKSHDAKYFAGEAKNQKISQAILHIRSYMEKHLAEKITISDLSRMLSVSPTYLKAEFRRIHGMSIHRCLIDLRMQRAYELIRCTDQPIYKIAQEVGYEGMSQFSAVFKKYYGTSPGQFKKCLKQEYCVRLNNDNANTDRYN